MATHHNKPGGRSAELAWLVLVLVLSIGLVIGGYGLGALFGAMLFHYGMLGARYA